MRHRDREGDGPERDHVDREAGDRVVDPADRDAVGDVARRLGHDVVEADRRERLHRGAALGGTLVQADVRGRRADLDRVALGDLVGRAHAVRDRALRDRIVERDGHRRLVLEVDDPDVDVFARRRVLVAEGGQVSVRRGEGDDRRHRAERDGELAVRGRRARRVADLGLVARNRADVDAEDGRVPAVVALDRAGEDRVGDQADVRREVGGGAAVHLDVGDVLEVPADREGEVVGADRALHTEPARDVRGHRRDLVDGAGRLTRGAVRLDAHALHRRAVTVDDRSDDRPGRADVARGVGGGRGGRERGDGPGPHLLGQEGPVLGVGELRVDDLVGQNGRIRVRKEGGVAPWEGHAGGGGRRRGRGDRRKRVGRQRDLLPHRGRRVRDAPPRFRGRTRSAGPTGPRSPAGTSC